jgi:hypothetical protein
VEGRPPKHGGWRGPRRGTRGPGFGGGTRRLRKRQCQWHFRSARVSDCLRKQRRPHLCGVHDGGRQRDVCRTETPGLAVECQRHGRAGQCRLCTMWLPRRHDINVAVGGVEAGPLRNGKRGGWRQGADGDEEEEARRVSVEMERTGMLLCCGSRGARVRSKSQPS